MEKKQVVIITDYTETPLTLDELCEICHFSKDMVNDLVKYEIIHPLGKVPEEWIFDLDELKRAKKAVRLRRDFEVNLEAIALVLDLLEEMEQLRSQVEFLKKHYSF